MSNKTFKSIAPGSNATIEVAATDGNMTVYVHQNIGAIDLSANDAPALALAILEAAGVEPLPHGDESEQGTKETLEDVTYWLARHVSFAKKRADAAAKEAADREALEAEAWALYKVWNPGTDHENFASVPEMRRAEWVNVAKAARELHGGTK